jgi:hypothetical protein
VCVVIGWGVRLSGGVAVLGCALCVGEL